MSSPITRRERHISVSEIQQENQELRIQLKSAQDYIKVVEGQLDKSKSTNDTNRNQVQHGNDILQMENQLQQLQLVGNEVQSLQRDKQILSAELMTSRNQLELFQKSIERLKEANYAFKLENDTYKEDFKRERHDREKAQSRIVELEKDLEIARTLLNQYSEQHALSASQRRANVVQKIREDYYRAHPYCPTARHRRNSYIGRSAGRIVCDGEDEDVIDSLVEPQSPTSGPSPRTSVSSDSNTLQCPKCNAEWPIDSHCEFLEHIDVCPK